ncbi:MAG: hypothetical protein RLP44_29875 [Aggregatilineales bacterium]
MSRITPENVNDIQEIARIGEGWLDDVSWSPTGEMIAVAGSLGVWIYDARDLTSHPRLLEGHSRTVTDVLFDPTGEIIASAGQDDHVILWDVESGNMLHQFEGRPALLFNQAGTIIAFQDTSGENNVVLYSVESGERLATLPGNDLTQLFSLQFSPDESMLVGVYRSYRWAYANAVKVWDLESNAVLFQTPEGEGTANYADFTEDMHSITLYDTESLAREWNISTRRLIHTESAMSPLETDTRFIRDVVNQFTGESRDYNGLFPYSPYSFSPDRERFAVISDQLEIWDVNTGLLQRSQGDFFPISGDMAIDETHSLLAIHSGTQILLWSLIDLEAPTYIDTLNIDIPRTKLLFTESGGLLIHDLTSHELSFIANPLLNTDISWAIDLDLDHASAVTSYGDSVLIVSVDGADSAYHFEELDIETGNVMSSVVRIPFLNLYERLDQEVMSVTTNSQVSLIATGSSVTRLWDLETKEEVAALFDYHNPEGFWPTNELAFSRDGSLLLAGVTEFGSGILVWDTSVAIATYSDVQNDIFTETGSYLSALHHGTGNRSAVFFAEDRLVVTGGSDDIDGIIWSSNGWSEVARLTGHRTSLTDVIVVDDRVIITSSGDGTIRFWGIS